MCLTHAYILDLIDEEYLGLDFHNSLWKVKLQKAVETVAFCTKKQWMSFEIMMIMVFYTSMNVHVAINKNALYTFTRGCCIGDCL